MPTGRLNMRRIRDVLRLKFGQGLSERQITVSLGLGTGRCSRDAMVGLENSSNSRLSSSRSGGSGHDKPA